MEIVRLKLTPDDISPPNIRYDETADTTQITNDGGTTWVDVPEIDPRSVNQFDPLSGATASCDAAARIVAALQDLVASILLAGDEVSQAAMLAILFGWLAVFGLFAVLVALLALVAAAIIAVGFAAFEAAFLNFDWDELTCIISCYVNAQGRLDQNALTDLETHVSGRYDGTQAQLINLFLSTAGFGGLNAFAASRSETGDCGACDSCTWCWEWDEAEIYDVAGSFLVNEDVVGLYTVVDAMFEANIRVTRIEFDFAYTPSGGATFVDGGGGIYNETYPSDPLASNTPQSPPGGTVVFDEPDGLNITALHCYANSRFDAPGANYPLITHVLIEGTGASPEFANGSSC